MREERGRLSSLSLRAVPTPLGVGLTPGYGPLDTGSCLMIGETARSRTMESARVDHPLCGWELREGLREPVRLRLPREPRHSVLRRVGARSGFSPSTGKISGFRQATLTGKLTTAAFSVAAGRGGQAGYSKAARNYLAEQILALTGFPVSQGAWLDTGQPPTTLPTFSPSPRTSSPAPSVCWIDPCCTAAPLPTRSSGSPIARIQHGYWGAHP